MALVFSDGVARRPFTGRQSCHSLWVLKSYIEFRCDYSPESFFAGPDTSASFEECGDLGAACDLHCYP